MSDLSTGTRVYFRGDVANHDGFGTIAARTVSKWGVDLLIAFEDGRRWWTTPNSFLIGNGGRRFYLASEVDRVGRPVEVDGAGEIILDDSARYSFPPVTWRF